MSLNNKSILITGGTGSFGKMFTKLIIEKYPDQNEPISFHPSLSELADFRLNRKPILFMTKEEHGALRSLRIAEEFNLLPWLLGSGYEYRRLGECWHLMHISATLR